MNNEMSITKEKEDVIWEEKNLTESQKKLENNGESDACGIIIVTNELKETVPSIDTIKIKKKISGIYKIINKVNGKYYVGSAKNVRDRWAGHKHCLNKNIHKNSHLQSSWKKYGSNNFEFLLIKEVELNILLIEEQKYLNIAKSEQDKCYNKSFLADRIEMTPKVIDKIRESNRRRIWSEESLLKLSKIHKGQKHTEKTKQLLSRLLKGRKISDETKLKIGKSMKGKLLGNKHPFYGTHRSKETVERMRNGKKDKTIYTFKNIKTNESFTGIKYDFIKKFNIHKSNVYRLVSREIKQIRGWILNEKVKSSPISQN